MKYSFLLFTLLFVSGNINAQQVRVLSLEEIFSLGTENSLRLNASKIQEAIADERSSDARSSRLPDINVGATTGYLGQPVLFQQGLTGVIRPESPDWHHNYNLSVVQPIYQGGRIRYNIEKTNLQRQIAGLTTTNDKAEVKMILLRQYLNLFSLYKQKEVFARNIEEADRRLSDIHRMGKEGLVTRNDEIRSELELTNYRLTYRETQDNIALVSQQLDILLGLDETLMICPDTSLLSVYHPIAGYEYYIERAYDNYPEINIARQSTAIAKNDIRITRTAYMPSLLVQGSNTLARPLTSPMTDIFSNNWNVMISLSFNISSFYHNRHKMREAKYSVMLSENREQQIMQQLRINIKSAYTRHNEVLDRVKSLELAVIQADENYRIVNNRYLNQLSILTDLLDASNIRLQAELQLTTARAESIYTYYELLRASGNL